MCPFWPSITLTETTLRNEHTDRLPLSQIKSNTLKSWQSVWDNPGQLVCVFVRIRYHGDSSTVLHVCLDPGCVCPVGSLT